MLIFQGVVRITPIYKPWSSAILERERYPILRGLINHGFNHLLTLLTGMILQAGIHQPCLNPKVVEPIGIVTVIVTQES